jgi:hypothetical protein
MCHRFLLRVKNYLAFLFGLIYCRGMTANQVIKFYGGKTSAATALGLTLQTLRHWKKHGIPKRTQAWIQLETLGSLKAERK